jgi:DNA-directed RNA polymerase subunit RPC12/RpoP
VLADGYHMLRCCDCLADYPQPPRGEEVVCPECGSRTWVSSRIPVEPPERVE